MRVGAHESVAGGLDKAFAHADEHGCEALQIFTKNSNQWKEPSLSREQIAAFRDGLRSFGRPVVAHDSYLVNLCADRDDVLERSRAALLHELERCDALGVDFVAFHPGAANALPIDVALSRVAESLSMILEKTRGAKTRLCLENTAGQGTCVGWSLDEIAAILDRTDGGERLGVCIDTQHLFAAGHDLRSAAGYDGFWKRLDDAIGLERVACFHLNDSKKPLGERVDRHEEIGVGEIGLYPFWRLMNDPRFENVPGVLELPPDATVTNLGRLVGLRGAREPKQTKIVAPLTLSAPEPKAKRPSGRR
jgi:deoxyribonuclease-4